MPSLRSLLVVAAAALALNACVVELPFSTPLGQVNDSSVTFPDGASWIPPESPDAGGDAAATGLSIRVIEPASGSSAGGEQVRIDGAGFVDGVRVLFGEAEAPEVFVQGGTRLTVRTPPHQRGVVDVSIIRRDGLSATFTSGFLFEAAVEVHDVSPTAGPATGGTPIRVRGAGFDATSHVLVGDRVAPAVEFVDEHTLLAIAPVGLAGPADVFVTVGGQTGRLRDGFRYLVAPAVERIDPATGPLAGGTEVRLVGDGLGSDDLHVTFGGVAAEILSATATEVVVLSPQGRAPGAVAVRARTAAGDVRAEGSFVYVDALAMEPAVVAVTPARGRIAGGEEVDVVVAGLSAAAVDQVTFAGATAEIVAASADDRAVTVRTPPGAVGVADVAVIVGDDTMVGPELFTYTWPLEIHAVAPDRGPTAGGTEVEVTGDGFFDGVEVRFGALPAQRAERVDRHTLRAVTPPGAPGSVPVSVHLGERTATADEAFSYDAAGLEVFLMHPLRGARAGGTWFRIVGAGFSPDTRVTIGDREADIEVHGSQLITGTSPRGVPGVAEIRVRSGGEVMSLDRGWLYFDPITLRSGTWGDPVDEAVNVTVLEAGTGNPVMGAFVTLGADPATPYQALTDLNGQITLSGPGLRGPVTMTAAKDGYTAYSIVEFDAENATVFLSRLDPPQPGPPPPGQPLSPGAVEGRVDGLGKYVVAPPGDCDDARVTDPETGITYCQSCRDDGDCNGGFCVQAEEGQPFCTGACTTDAQCPADFVCANFGWPQPRCLPAPGTKEIRCFVTGESIFGLPPQPLPGGVLRENGTFSFDARLGDVSIVCLGGVVDDAGEFTPLVMGIRRHTPVLPGETTPRQDIQLNIPLTGRLSVRLGNPLDPAIFPRQEILVFMDLGSDGVFPIGRIDDVDAIGERFDLVGMPAALGGDLEDIKLIFRVELRPEPPAFLPGAEILVDNLDPQQILHRVMLTLDEHGAYVPRSIGQAPDIDAAASDGARTFAVGARGAILHWNGQHLSVQSSPTRRDLHGITALPEGGFLAVGNGGTVLRYDGAAWTTLPPPTDADLHGVLATAEATYVVGRGVILRQTDTGWVQQGFGFPQALYGIAQGADGQLVAVGEAGVVWRRRGASWNRDLFPTNDDLLAVDAHAGRFAAVGEAGLVAVHDGEGWEILDAPTFDSLRAVRILDDGSLVVGGPLGQMWFWNGEKWRSLTSEESLLDVRVMLGDRRGIPAVVFGHHEVYLGPLLDPHEVLQPTVTVPMQRAGILAWSVPETPRELLNYIRLSDATGFPMWTVVAGGVERVELPDLWSMAGIQVLMPGSASMRMVRALAPGFDIDNYSSRQLSIFEWRSWTTVSQPFSAL